MAPKIPWTFPSHCSANNLWHLWIPTHSARRSWALKFTRSMWSVSDGKFALENCSSELPSSEGPLRTSSDWRATLLNWLKWNEFDYWRTIPFMELSSVLVCGKRSFEKAVRKSAKFYSFTKLAYQTEKWSILSSYRRSLCLTLVIRLWIVRWSDCIWV